jgi:ubiquitin-activating enzyme E1 C
MTKRNLPTTSSSSDEEHKLLIDSTTTTTMTMESDSASDNVIKMPSRGNLSTILSRASKFPNESGALPIGEFVPLEELGGSGANMNSAASASTYTSTLSQSALATARVLVVGAGGLGCELLKDLAMSGIVNVDVIDMDTIDVTNLNRQFLFRQKDVGHPKSLVAATFINQKCPWMNVVPHYGNLKDKPASWYAHFQCILVGLDSVEARRWLNAMICGLVELDEDGDPDPSTIIPMVDGGTEGFRGQARLILPRVTSCFECSLDAFPPQRLFPMCTIAETPRLPEHCISYAFLLEWPKVFGADKKLDSDSPEDMKWVYETALERAETYNIQGVTYMLTMGVVKNIIPAVASTNAIVAAACVNECIKLLTFCAPSLNTYMMYMGTASVYSHTFVYERKDDCPVCTSAVHTLTDVDRSMTLKELQQALVGTGDTDGESAEIASKFGGKLGNLRLTKPSMTTASGKTLYMPNPPALERATRPNLDKTLGELLLSGADGETLTITDPAFPGNTSLSLSINFAATSSK